MDILKLIGPSPLGDPNAMRRRAQELMRQADVLGAASARAQASVSALPFEGPAASRFRRDMGQAGASLQRDVARIRELAAYLLQAASQTETAQNDWRRRYRRLEQQARDALRKGGLK